MTDDNVTLKLSQVTVAFGGNRVLNGIDVAFTPGFNGLIGPNGAGKTTTLNLISGYVPTSSGDITLNGKSLCGLSQMAITASGIGRTFQAPRLILDATVMDNVLLGCHTKYRWGHAAELFKLPFARAEERRMREACMDKLELFSLADFAHVPASALPLGSQKIVEVARATVSEPAVVLLDEPAAGLGVEDVSVLLSGLREICRSRSVTMVIIEHDLELVNSLCHTVHVLDYGKIIAVGPPAEAIRNPLVVEAYLGSGFVDTTRKDIVHEPT